jgi:hypothetical protein
MSERTIEFPITGDTIYPIGVYSFEDTVTGEAGTITIEKWGGSDQAIEETTITGVTQGIVEEVGVQENVVVVVTHEDDTQTNKRAHSDYIYEFIDTYGLSLDVELEAKAKELALKKYVKQYQLTLV